MITATDLTRDGKLLAPAIDAAAVEVAVDATSLAAALPAAASVEHRAALALIAGRTAESGSASMLPLLPTLIAQLGADGWAGKAAAWALGRMATNANSADKNNQDKNKNNSIEEAVLAVIATGDLDTRENGYAALAGVAARGVASPTLGTALAQRVDAEIAKAKSGGTGLGEHACRALAVLGHPGTSALIQQVIENDRFCDRFELQRLRKAVDDGGRDRDTADMLRGGWQGVFADAIYAPPAPKPEPVVESPSTKPAGKSIVGASGRAIPSAKAPVSAPAPSSKLPVQMAAPKSPANPPSSIPATDGSDAATDAQDDTALDGDLLADGTQPTPIDWPAFLASPEVAALPANQHQLVAQLGPLLEQLAIRGLRAPLTDLVGQELAALLLQVLPQALPPQHVQMALSPQAINCYQALVKYLVRTGLATHGEDLLSGIKQVRKELVQQMRQSGMLGGPDYSDPDEKPPIK